MPYPDALMLFAAGFGTRMGDLTRTRPKPLIEVAGKPLIDHAISLTEGAGLRAIVANTHYLAEQIAAHLAPRGIAVSHEAQILETGGGLRKALPLLGDGPVFTLNTDAVWTGTEILAHLRQIWQPEHMDALLLLVPRERAIGYQGQGDFLRAANGQIARGAGDVYTGLQIINPKALNPKAQHSFAENVFSLNMLWDKMAAEGRLYGAVHHGQWCDVGRPSSIPLAEAMLREAQDV